MKRRKKKFNVNRAQVMLVIGQPKNSSSFRRFEWSQMPVLALKQDTCFLISCSRDEIITLLTHIQNQQSPNKKAATNHFIDSMVIKYGFDTRFGVNFHQPRKSFHGFNTCCVNISARQPYWIANAQSTK